MVLQKRYSFFKVNRSSLQSSLPDVVQQTQFDEQIEQIFNEISVEDEVVILTDLLAGSVNQKFVPYSSRPHTHLVAGMNLPLAMAFSMEPCHEYMSSDRIRENRSKKHKIK